MNATHKWWAWCLQGPPRAFPQVAFSMPALWDRSLYPHAAEEGPDTRAQTPRGGGGGTGTDSGLLYLCTLDFPSCPIFLCPAQKADLSKER